jgi:hypothetical protein
MKSRKLGLSTLSAIGMLLAAAGPARAQEPGTNMATPPPQAQPAPTTQPHHPSQTDTSDASRSPLFTASIAPEPVIDPQTTRSTFPNRPLLITGLFLLAGSYGTSVIVAATSDRPADEKLYYPVAGPWMALDKWDCDKTPCKNEDLSRGLLIGDGIVQGVGALSILLSLVIPEKTTRRWYLIGNDSVTIAPRVGQSMTGVGMVGRF